MEATPGLSDHCWKPRAWAYLRKYHNHPFPSSYNAKVITIYNTTSYSSCDHTLSEGKSCLQGCFYLIRRKIRSTGVLLSSFSTKTCPWTLLLRSYENLLSLSKASVLVMAKPHLAHKSCGPGDEDRLVFVKSCNRTQTWWLFHLVASVHIRSVWFSFPTSSLSLPLEKLSIPLPRRPLLLEEVEEDILSFNLLPSLLVFVLCYRISCRISHKTWTTIHDKSRVHPSRGKLITCLYLVLILPLTPAKALRHHQPLARGQLPNTILATRLQRVHWVVGWTQTPSLLVANNHCPVVQWQLLHQQPHQSTLTFSPLWHGAGGGATHLP